MSQKRDHEASDKSESSRESKASVTLPGTVEKIIPPIDPREAEKAQIGIEGADHLYREIRVDNRLKDEKGNEVSLKPGSEVDVTIEADGDAVDRKKPNASATKSDSNENSPRAGLNRKGESKP